MQTALLYFTHFILLLLCLPFYFVLQISFELTFYDLHFLNT